MFENYLSHVRKELNTKAQRKQLPDSGFSKAIGNINTKNQSPKFKEYKSENVFEPDQLFPTKANQILDFAADDFPKPKKMMKTKYLQLAEKDRAEAYKKKNNSSNRSTKSSNNSKNKLTPSKSELEETLIPPNPHHKHIELPTENFKYKGLSTVSNKEKPVKRKRKKNKGNKVSAQINYESQASGRGKLFVSVSDKSMKRNTLDYWKSFSDAKSLTKDFSKISANFDSENLIGQEEMIKVIKSHNKNVSNALEIEDSNEMNYDFEKASGDASFSEMSMDNVDFGYSFNTKALKNVKIRSGTICDEDSLTKSLPYSSESLETIDNNSKRFFTGNLPVMQPEDEFSINNDSFADQSGKIDTADTNTISTAENNRIKNQRSTNTTYISVNSDRLVILKRGEVIPLFGICALKVLYGKLEVLGYILNEESDEINLYSPRGSALLYLRNVTISEMKGYKNVKKKSWFSNLTIDNTDVVLRFRNLQDIKISFIERYISQQIFPKIYDKDPRVVFDPKESMPVIMTGKSWNTIIDSITSQSKLLVTGGKGVGKSTFLRYAINRLLCTYDKIRVIDLDTGQSEFAVPGCISVISLTEPVFGPNYTHLRKPERSYLSNINVGTDPRSYINCIKLLMEYVNTLEHLPTLVNYMGFVKGIGLNIISSAITFVKPTDVIQINSTKRKNNFNTNLSLLTVANNCNLFGSGDLNFDMRVHILDAMNDKNVGWSLEPRQMRELSVLAYLGQMIPDNDVVSLTSEKLPMFKFNLSSIKVADIYGNNIQLAAINANLVAMCNKNVISGIFTCLGFGVVRGIDLENNYLILMTPENPLVLNKVEYLVLTSVLLPPSIYMCPDDVAGEIPYVMDGQLVSLAQITRRSYLPAGK